MRVLRTPEDRFEGLPDFGYQPRYADAGGLRVAYDAPFPDPSYMAAVRAMPDLVPADPDNPASEANRAAWRQLAQWDKPFLAAFSDRDPVTAPWAPALKREVPGARGREHPVLRGAGHFLQEDAGEELGEVIAGFVRAT